MKKDKLSKKTIVGDFTVTIFKCEHEQTIGECIVCRIAEENKKSLLFTKVLKNAAEDKRIPIRRGCPAAGNGGCFCTGRCQEVIGYVEDNSGFGIRLGSGLNSYSLSNVESNNSLSGIGLNSKQKPNSLL